MDKYIKFSEVLEYLRSRSDEARQCGHEETYFDLLTIIDGLKNVETIQAIPVRWVGEYADWLTTIPAPFAANDEKSIRAMLTKWKTNPDLPQVGCSEDACEIGG